MLGRLLVRLVVCQVQRRQHAGRLQQLGQQLHARRRDRVVRQVQRRQRAVLQQAGHEHHDQVVVDHVAGQGEGGEGVGDAQAARQRVGVGEAHAEQGAVVPHAQVPHAVRQLQGGEVGQARQDELHVQVRRHLLHLQAVHIVRRRHQPAQQLRQLAVPDGQQRVAALCRPAARPFPRLQVRRRHVLAQLLPRRRAVQRVVRALLHRCRLRAQRLCCHGKRHHQCIGAGTTPTACHCRARCADPACACSHTTRTASCTCTTRAYHTAHRAAGAVRNARPRK